MILSCSMTNPAIRGSRSAAAHSRASNERGEMNVEPVDVRNEVRHGVEPRFDLAPVVLSGPVMRQFLHGGERHTLREIGDCFSLRQARGPDASAQILEVGVGDLHAEGTDGGSTNRIAPLCAFSVVLPRRLADNARWG